MSHCQGSCYIAGPSAFGGQFAYVRTSMQTLGSHKLSTSRYLVSQVMARMLATVRQSTCFERCCFAGLPCRRPHGCFLKLGIIDSASANLKGAEICLAVLPLPVQRHSYLKDQRKSVNDFISAVWAFARGLQGVGSRQVDDAETRRSPER